MTNTPVVLMTYNRPRHTRKVLDALRRHNVQNLFIFSDGPKSEKDLSIINETRLLIHRIDWTTPQIVEQEKNLGLAKSIIGAVNHVFQNNECMILLEDDCVPQKYFFDFIENCLEKYRDHEKIFGISGYTVPIPDSILDTYPYDLYFFPRIGSWGWATWKNRWQSYESDLFKAYERAVAEKIDLDQGGTDIPHMLQQMKSGHLKDVWTLNWLITVYLNKGYYIYPTLSHIENIGMDGSGRHCCQTDKFSPRISDTKPTRYPDCISINKEIYGNFKSYYDVQHNLMPSKKTSNKQKEKLKIVHLCTYDFGGAGKAAYRLHKGLQKIGCDSTMLVMNKRSEDPSVKVLPFDYTGASTRCLDVTTFESPSWDRQWMRWNSLISQYKNRPDGLEIFSDALSDIRLDLIQEIKDADIIHLHWVAGLLNYPSAPSAFDRKPIVWTLHDMNPFTGGCHYSGNCKKYANTCGGCPQLGSDVDGDLSREIWNQKFSTYQGLNLNIVTPSQWLGQCASESKLISGFPVKVIPYGFPIDIFKPYPKSNIRKAINIPEAAKIILFGAAAIDNDRKGFGYLLEALERIPQNGKYEIVVFTFGAVPEEFKIASKHPVCHLGHFADEKELAIAYSAADVFVIPSLEDNLPNTVIEAMACGTPVVGFDVGGLPDMIDHKQNGFLASSQDVGCLLEGIDWAFSSSDRDTNISARCRQKAVTKYPLEVQAKAYQELYEQIIAYHDVKNPTKANGLNQKIEDIIQKGDGSKKTSRFDGVRKEIITINPNKQYLVSAIVSTYNSERYLRGCLEDLEAQTISDQLEIIVVNSGSEQNEESIVKEFQDKYANIKYIKTEARESVYAAWNRGIREAAGKYITNANTDDRHRNDAFEVIVTILETLPEVALVYADLKITATANERFDQCTPVGNFSWLNWSRKDLLNQDCFIGPQPMWRKAVHEKYGYFDESLVVAGDYEFWLRISQTNTFLHIPVCLGLYLRSPDSIEHANLEILKEEKEKIINMYKNASQTDTIIGALKYDITDDPSFSTDMSGLDDGLIKADQYFQMGCMQKAITMLMECIRRSPEDKQPYYVLAEQFIDVKNFKDALDVLNEMPSDDHDLKKLALMGYCKEGLQDYDEADALANQVLGVNPRFALALNLKGTLAYRQKKRDAAEDYFKKAIDAEPTYGEAYTNLGTLEWENGEIENALDLFEDSVRLSPTVADIVQIYHAAITTCGRYERSEPIFERVFNVHPCNKRLSHLFIDVLIKLGKYDRAMDAIENAIHVFGIDEDGLAAAMKVRQFIGPLEISREADDRRTLSLCMIVKNEARHLANCLASVKPLVDEIIVVDTGSEDHTKTIAKIFGAKVFDYQWGNDYAAARNHSLSMASGQWVLVMDADEVISPLDYEKFEILMGSENKESVAYSIVTRNYTMRVNTIGWVTNTGEYREEAGSGWFPSEKVRLFPNHAGIRFEYPVHELVDPCLQRAGIRIETCPIPVHHYGDLNPQRTDRKGKGYWDLGSHKLDESENDVVALREIAVQAGNLQKYEEAIGYWQQLLALQPDMPEAYVNMGSAYWQLGDCTAALTAAQKAVSLDPQMKEARFNKAISELFLGNLRETICILEKLVQEFPDYLAALFMLSASYCCNDGWEKGMQGIQKLGQTKMGKGLCFAFADLANRLVSAQKEDFAVSVLEAAIESHHSNDDIVALLERIAERN
jgi:glycosyltransferase involved in cell wall biosynthesis/Tfp pilus assembly protein PilF